MPDNDNLRAIEASYRYRIDESRAVRARPILGAGTLFLSAGAAELQEGDRPNDLFERADDALYRAKELGKARTVLANGA